MKELAVAIMLAILPGVYGQGTLKLDIQREMGVQRLRPRAQGSTDVSLLNNLTEGVYVATVTVGTPPQTLKLQVDTGSSDTWVPASNASICQEGKLCFYGSCMIPQSNFTYNSAQSSTFSLKFPKQFSIGYGDGTSSNGSYFTDTLTMGGTTVKSLTMGLGTETDNPYGLVGVGFASNEAIAEVDPSKVYPNLPIKLQQDGLIASTAFSLWLNDIHSDTGSILFGGVDTARFSGSLTRLKMLPSTPGSQNITEFNVALSSVTAVSSTGRDSLGSSSFPATVLLDSGGTISTLPDDLVDEIWHEAGAIQDEVGTPHVPCSFANNDAWFEFGFGGPGGAVIKVSLSQLVSGGPIRIAFTNGTYKGQEACGFGIRKGGGRSVLGDTFLRSAYVVYDLENLEIGLADAIFNKTSSGSSVVPFARKAAPIPSSTPAPSQDSAAMRAAAVTATPTVYAAANGFQSNTTTKSAALSGPRGNWKFTISLVVGLVLILSL